MVRGLRAGEGQGRRARPPSPACPPPPSPPSPPASSTPPSAPYRRAGKDGTVSDLCDSITSGGTPSKKSSLLGGWKHRLVQDRRTYGWSTIYLGEKITDEALANSSCKMWLPGTILFALYASPTVGRLGVLTHPWHFESGCCRLGPRRPKSERSFSCTRFWLCEYELQRIAVCAAQQNINQGVLKSTTACSSRPITMTGAFSTNSSPLFFNYR